jgi:Resolvase, N terminal domain
VLDELSRLNIEFISFREQIDTGGPLGRAVVVIIGVVAELERSLIVERVRAGMRWAKLEGQHIGRKPLDLDRVAILRDLAERSEPQSTGKGPPRFPGHYPSDRRGKNPTGKCCLKMPRNLRRLNPKESMAGSHLSGCSIKCGFKNKSIHP